MGFFNDFKDIDSILSNQIVRYRTGFKLIFVILIVSLLLSIITGIYMVSMLGSTMDIVDKRNYIILTDSKFVQTKGNYNIQKYFESIAQNISRNLFSIVPQTAHMNSEYIKDYSSSKEVIEGYYKWLSEKVNYLETIRAFSVFIPDISSIDSISDTGFDFSINSDWDKSNILDVTIRIDGTFYTISNLKPISIDYTLIMYITMDNSKVNYNQQGFNIYKMDIYETKNYLQMLYKQNK
jgi:hypothetical protein